MSLQLRQSENGNNNSIYRIQILGIKWINACIVLITLSGTVFKKYKLLLLWPIAHNFTYREIYIISFTYLWEFLEWITLYKEQNN